jgi:hypothetical protein
MPWLLFKGQWKMLANFAVVIEVASVMGTWQNKQLPNVCLSHNNHKKGLRTNVAFTSSMGRIATIVVRR